MTARKLVWLASYPKSGNTWTRAFLLHLFLNPKQPLSPSEVSEMSPIDSARYWYEQASGEEPDVWDEAKVAGLRSAMQREIANYALDSIFVKTHCALTVWYGHPVIDFEQTAGAVYILRNPLDVAASYAAHIGRDLDRTIAIMNNRDYVAPGLGKHVPHLMGTWSQHVLSWTARPNPGLHIMGYEDMVEKPKETFGGLVKFFGLNTPPERLERALKFSSFDTLKTMEDKHGFVERTDRQERFFRSGKVGGWRQELTDDQARKIVGAHREQMARFNYIPDGF